MKIICETECSKNRYRKALRQYGKLAEHTKKDCNDTVELVIASDHVYLQRVGAKANHKKPQILTVDFMAGAIEYRRRFGGGRQQDLCRAVGLNKNTQLKVIDATAGLAHDAYVFASLGAEVTMLEQSPVLCLLVREALQRTGLSGSGLQRKIVSRMVSHCAYAQQWLEDNRDVDADVIYLDPMFPTRKKLAAVKKDMQILHDLHGIQTEAERIDSEVSLLTVALKANVKRVVVKRSLFSPVIEGSSPSYQLSGKTTRYDIYALRSID